MPRFEALMPSVEAVTYLVNLSVAVSLVCGVGLLAARACRRGSAPLRHGVLGWTLALILFSPAAVWVAQQNGLALVRLTISSAADTQRASMADAGRSAELPSPSGRGAGGEGRDGNEINDHQEWSRASSPHPNPLPAGEGTSLTVSSKEPPLAGWQVMGSMAAVLWLVGAAVGLVQLGWGYAALARFCRRLDPLSDPRQKLLVHQAADALGLRKLPLVFFSPSAGIPVSIGLLNPAIVLPEAMPREADDEQLQAVLIHEMAHIARHDHWVGVAQRMAAVLFWWNPLVHWACNEISELREEICDNHVVLVQGEGRRLARILVDLAARVAREPLLPSTVGVLEPRLAGLTGRVTRLLDKERDMETRMNRTSKVLVFACSLAALIGMATIGGLRLAYAEPANEAQRAEAEQAIRDRSDSVGAKAGALLGAMSGELAKSLTKADAHGDRFDFHGQVLDPDGKPLPGARIYLVFARGKNGSSPKLRATTDSKGKFQFAMERSEFDKLRSMQIGDTHRDVNFRNDCRVVAQADGFGPVWQPAFAFDESGEIGKRMRQAHPADAEALHKKRQPLLRVVKDDVPLVGRIVDTKGHPLAGVKIRVRAIEPVKNEDLTGWLSAAEKKNADMTQTAEYESLGRVPGGTFTDDIVSSEVLPQIMPTATSDADGRFRLTGIGRERIAMLSIEGPKIELPCWVHARTRPGPTLVLPYSLPANPTKWTFYGATFEHVARPSVPIVGTVRDKDTGKPLPGVTVQAHKLANNPAHSFMVSYALRTTSDAEGRYRLTGMPIGKGHELLVVPPKDQPYLYSKKIVDTAVNGESVPTDIALKRGTWIRGKVTDARTGAPVSDCTVDYYVFRNNPHYKLAPGFDGANEVVGTYQTDRDGRYAVPGLPGRGIVTVQARGEEQTRYAFGVGIDKMPGRGKLADFAPSPLYTFGKHALAEVNPPEGAQDYQLDFQLDPGQTLTGTVLDPAGKPLTGAYYSGLAEEGPWNLLGSSAFTINCYRPDHPRKVWFVHLERKLAGSLFVTGVQTGPLSAKLQPWGAITGRVVDAKGKPMAGVRLLAEWPTHLLQETPNGQPRFLDLNGRTDRDGRFRIEGLAPGMTYSPWIWGQQPGQCLGVNVFEVALSSGETKDLGNVRTTRISPSSAFAQGPQITVNLETPNLVPPAVQFAVFDKDPVIGLEGIAKRYREQIAREADKAPSSPSQQALMSTFWNLSFKDITADRVHLLIPGGQTVGTSGPDGRRWIVSKTVRIKGKVCCWCIPVDVKKGELTNVTLREDNMFDLKSTVEKAMQESGPAK